MGDDFFVCKYISFCTKIASNPLVVSYVGYLLSMLFAVYKVAAWNHKHRARAFSPSHNDVRGREGELDHQGSAEHYMHVPSLLQATNHCIVYNAECKHVIHITDRPTEGVACSSVSPA